MSDDQFYLRYYVGHRGKFGHEYLEFEFRPDGEVQLNTLTACKAPVVPHQPLTSAWQTCAAAIQEQLKLQE